VVIDLDENRLHFMQGELTLWSAPVGTGTGMRVITEDNDWDFSTPTGTFEVQFKERDPVWIAPDWYFAENNLPVPPANHTSRYMRGTLGVAAVYISPHLAIHGTQRPDLIGQRVSHGCIRLENRYALRLFHNVQIGTEVIILGGEDIEDARVVDLREGYDPSLASSGGGRPLPVDPRFEEWKAMATPALLRALDTELDWNSRSSRWDEVALMLVDRARDDDEAALMGLLRRSGGLPAVATEIEWATFLADVYRGAALRTLEGLARLDARERQDVAGMIVEAMITLYHGEFDEPSVPWPTSQLPAQMVTREGRPGYAALIAAEREQRDRIRTLAAETVN